MTQDEMIEMARQADIRDSLEYDHMECNIESLEAFAKLVAQHERKECEKIIWNADAWIGSDAKIWIVKSIQEARGQA
jgi:uncharacterized protein involved in copper resistance